MGRRRTGGAEPLPQAVRRNNAKNERKTMEAIAENLWSSVESGKERRLRLAAERLCQLPAAPEKAPTQQNAADAATKPDMKTDGAPTQQKGAEAPAKPDTNPDKDSTPQMAAEPPSTPEKEGEKAPIQQEMVEVLTTPDTGAYKTSTQPKETEASTIPGNEGNKTLTQQKPKEPSPGPDTESDALLNQQRVSMVSTTTESSPEVKDVREAASPDETLAEAAVPTGDAEVPEYSEEISLSSWEVIDAPTHNDAYVEIETFEAGEALITTQEPVENIEPTHQDVETMSSNEESVKYLAQTTNFKEREGTIVAIADTPVSSKQGDGGPSIEEQHANALASDQEPVDVLVGEISKGSPAIDDVDMAPVAETAETGVTGKEADLPTASQSDVMAEPLTSPTEELTETATMEQDLEHTDSKDDSKKKRKKKKKDKHTAEPPPATAPTELENEHNADSEQGQQAKSGKKHKRHKDKRKESQSESEKGVTVEDDSGGQVPTTYDVVSGTSLCSPTSSEIAKTDEKNQDANDAESKTVDPVDEEWTTYETKKTKRRRKRSERKSESEEKNRTDDHHESDLSPEVKQEPNIAAEDQSSTERLTEQVTNDSTSKKRLADEAANSTGTTLDAFDHLVSSIGDLKEKCKQASEAKAEQSMTANKTLSESIDEEEKVGDSFAVKAQDKIDSSDMKGASGNDSSNEMAIANINPETVAKETTTVELLLQEPSQSEKKSTKDADAAPDAFDLLVSAGAGLETGFYESFSTEEQIDQQKTNETTETKPATVLQEPVEVLPVEPEDAPKTADNVAKETDAAPDAFDLLLAGGDALGAGFNDAFGEEDQSGDMSARNDLQEELKDSFCSEQVPLEPEQQQQRNESTEAKPATVWQEPVEAVSPEEPDDAPKPAKELTNVADSAPDAFDLLMSGGDDLGDGFNDAFGEEDKSEDMSARNDLQEELKGNFCSEQVPLELEQQQQRNESTEAKLATVWKEPVEAVSPEEPDDAPKPAKELTNESDAAPDAFDLLMSGGDDLGAGFNDAFGEEDQSKDMSARNDLQEGLKDSLGSEQVPKETEQKQQKNKSTEAKPSTVWQEPVGAVSPEEPDDAPKPAKELTNETDAAPDAFDLLMSGGDDLGAGFNDAFGEEDHSTQARNDLQEGVKDSFGSEQVPKETEQQQQKNESTEAKPSTVWQEPVEAVSPAEPDDAPKPAKELTNETDAAPDAFDLLMSGGDDLGAGFNDAFGEEDQREVMSENNERKGQTQASPASNTAVCLIMTSADSSAVELEPKEAMNTEENLVNETESAIDAFDILMSAGDALQEGFKESFSLDEEVPEETKAVNTSETKQTAKETKEDAVSTKGTSVIELQAAFEAEEKNTSSDNEVPVIPVTTPEWIDKTIYDNAEAKYHEQVSIQQSRDNENKEGSVVNETETSGSVIQEATPKPSEIEVAETVRSDSEKSTKATVVPHESSWYDKTMHDNAETRYYERLSQDKISQHNQEDTVLPSAPEDTYLSCLSEDTEVDNLPSATKSGEAIEQLKNDNAAPESPPNSVVAPAESTWYDKVMHDEAETHHYERLSRSQRTEPSDKDKVMSSPATTEGKPMPPVISSEQTWFDKPFHDSAETVHHVRQGSNESDSSNRSFPLYEGCCEHFKPDDHQTPEGKVTHCCEVEPYDSWTESKLYNAPATPDKPTGPAQDPIKTDADCHEENPSGQFGEASVPQASSASQITVNIGEPPHSPTSDASRSRRSTFNSAASPLSPQVELDEVYFEDVVLAGRQSDVTMAALRGFTASPLSEGLAPGEQLDSLRTEPDLDLSEPGTADTLDDGEEGVQPFSYDDIGDEGSATPVGEAAVWTVTQSPVPEAKQSPEHSEKESKDDILSSASDDLINDVNLEVNIPAAELRRDVPSPSLDGSVTKSEMETSTTATMPTELPTVSLGADMVEAMTTSEVGSTTLQTTDIPLPNIDIEIPSVQLTAEILLEPETKSDQSQPEESTSSIVTSTPVKNETPSSPIPQAAESHPIPKVTFSSTEKAINSEVRNNEPSANGTKESLNISHIESPSEDINEKLGLNEDGTVSLKESDEEVIKFTEQGTPRSPVAPKRCSRKKKMRSGGRKNSSESVKSQTSDNAKTSAQDEPSKTDIKTPATDIPTNEIIVPSSEVIVAASPPSVVAVTAEPKSSTEDIAESIQEDVSLAPQPESRVSSDTSLALPDDDAASAQPKQAVSPVQTEPPSIDTETTVRLEIPVSPEESQTKPAEEESAVKPQASIIPVESQSETVEKEVADKPEVAVRTTQLETKPTDKETDVNVEASASPTQPQSKAADTETSDQVQPEASTISTEPPSEPANKPEVPVSHSEQQPKPGDKPEVRVGPPEPQPKPADKPPAVTTTVVSFSTPNKARPADQKPASKVPSVSLPILPDRTLFLPGDEGHTYASLMQQGADMMPARPVFTAHACHVCKRLHTKQSRLKSCGSCRLIAYCSAEHQRAHWPMHRALCKAITRRVRYLGTDHLYREAINVPSAEQWKKIRFKHMTVCEEMLGRPMEAYEKEMFLYPRACDTCHETNPEKLHTCAYCHSVSFCTEEHLRKNHSKYCKDLRLLLDIHSHQNAHGVCEPPLPETVLDTYEQLPPHIRELLVVSLLGPQRAMALGPVPLAVLSDYASYPLTLLYALQNIPTHPDSHISQLSELTVHVVGAEHATDCHPLSRWDAFLLHLLPRLRRLHVVFVGIELEAAGGRPGVTQRDFTCAACRAAGRRLTCELQPSTAYHTYCRSPQFRPPHVIAAFNAGLHRFAGHERRDTWRETIPYLVREGVPLVLSGYTLLECPQDVARIQQEQRVDVLLPPMKNPYRSTRPQQNFLNEHEAPVVFKNQYVACLTAAAPAKARK